MNNFDFVTGGFLWYDYFVTCLQSSLFTEPELIPDAPCACGHFSVVLHTGKFPHSAVRRSNAFLRPFRATWPFLLRWLLSSQFRSLRRFCAVPVMMPCQSVSHPNQRTTGLPNKACTWFGEVCSCSLSKGRNKVHQTTYKPYSRAL